MKKKPESTTVTPAPSFEAALVDLEQLVAQLEEGSLPLDESLRAYERGIGLVKHCQKLLDQAELRVRVLSGVNPDGTAILEEFQS